MFAFFKPVQAASATVPPTEAATVYCAADHARDSDIGPRDPGTTLTAWLPLRRYRLTIRHKLLSQLGRLSHFVIIALEQKELTGEQLQVLTALTGSQLEPIVLRLQNLQILDGLTLSRNGRRYAYLLRYLH